VGQVTVLLGKGRESARQLSAVLARLAWIIFLVCLPVTSFPFFPFEVGGSTLVRPLSIYPMIVLFLLVVLPRLLISPLPRTLLSFFPFLLVALAATLVASLQGIEAAQGVSVLARSVRALVTLFLGAAFYLTVVLWPQSKEDLRSSLRWIYAGFSLALLWGSLQALYVVRFSSGWFDFLSKIQGYISTRRLFPNRVSGLTYEPNWFADQISFLLLPWLLASILSGQSAFSWRWRWLTIEWLLLGWAVMVLPFTYSRAGLFILVVILLVSVLFFRPWRRPGSNEDRQPGSLPIRRLFEGALLVVVLGGIVYFTGTKNPFFARIWDYWERRPDQGYARYLAGYFEYLGFGARFTYWQTAFNIYDSHPLLGVGLGNYAFYFEENLPDQPLAAIPEVLRQIVPDVGREQLVTSKNFYLRLLAETGLLGTAAFIAFLTAILGCALFLWYSPGTENRFWGTAGLLGLAGFLLVAFSFDSFAIPNMWVVFGFITAAHRFSNV
jgi:F0F1-type ATP synthase membrane subunit c/vacuolar-type H+-ATPase subunit K